MLLRLWVCLQITISLFIFIMRTQTHTHFLLRVCRKYIRRHCYSLTEFNTYIVKNCGRLHIFRKSTSGQFSENTICSHWSAPTLRWRARPSEGLVINIWIVLQEMIHSEIMLILPVEPNTGWKYVQMRLNNINKCSFWFNCVLKETIFPVN